MSSALNALSPELAARLAPLADAGAWYSLKHLWCGMPPVWSWGCFEVRLTAADRRVDFLLCVQEDTGRRALAEALRGERLPRLEGVRPVLEDWLLADSPVGRRSPALWLEFDLPGDASASPFIYFVFNDAAADALAAPLTPAELRALVERHRRLLGLGDAGGAQLAAIERCAQALPAAGRIAPVAALEPARRRRDVRLVALLPGNDAWDWLQAIGWPGERQLWDFARAALGADGDGDWLQINVDVGEAVGPVLGLETGLLAAAEPGRDESRDLFRRLAG